MEMSMQQYIFANGYRVFGGTTEEWAAHDDPLYYRELGIEYTDDGRVLMKAGIRTEDDSPTPWSKLPYIYGKQGDKGDIGPEGPSPDFEWDGTKIRFKKPDGTWGVWVDLKGPKGDQGDPPEIAGSAYLILDDREYTDEEVRDAVEALDLPDGTICSVWFGDPGTDGGSDGVDGAASCLVDYTRPVNVPLTESEGAYTMDNAGIAPIDGQAVASISMTGSGNLTNRYFYISANDVTLSSGRLATATGAVRAHCFPFTIKWRYIYCRCIKRGNRHLFRLDMPIHQKAPPERGRKKAVKRRLKPEPAKALGHDRSKGQPDAELPFEQFGSHLFNFKTHVLNISPGGKFPGCDHFINGLFLGIRQGIRLLTGHPGILKRLAVCQRIK